MAQTYSQRVLDLVKAKHSHEKEFIQAVQEVLSTIRRGEAQTPQGRREILSIPRIPVIGTPSPDLVFEDHDILVLFGKETNLIEFAQLSKGL